MLSCAAPVARSIRPTRAPELRGRRPNLDRSYLAAVVPLAPLAVVVAVALAVSALSAPWTGWRLTDADGGLLHGTLAAALWALAGLLRVSIRRRRPRPLLRTARAWWRRMGGWTRLSNAVATILCLVGAGATASGWKCRLGHEVPFWADGLWYRLDLALHGGRVPAAWLAPVLERPPLVAAIELWYYPGCFAVSFAAFGALVWAPPGPQRTRVLLTVALAWLTLGAAVATLGASAGPLFHGFVTGGALPGGPDPYAWQLTRLAEVPTGLALRARDWLWAHQAITGPPSTGAAAISAFPSMHVAGMATYVLLARAFGAPRVVRLAWAALALTLLGSVLLGLHYAVDGYASLVGVAAIWWGVGRAQAWHDRQSGAT